MSRGTQTWGRLSVIATLAAIGAIAVTAAPAGAAKLKTRSASVAIAGTNSTGSAVATCPRGTKAVGGGFTTETPSLMVPTHLLVIHEARREGQRSWRASGAQLGTGASTLIASAYCENVKGKIKKRAKTELISNTVSTVTPVCPRRTKALFGGYVTQPNMNTSLHVVTESRRSTSTSWQSTAVWFSGPAKSFTSEVYCAKLPAGKQRSATVINPGASGTVASATSPPCPRGRSARSGGFNTPLTGSFGMLGFSFPYESQRVAGRWRTSSLQLGGGNPSRVISFGYCR